MARMIPAAISQQVTSDAEKKVFRWFRDCPGTEDWIVLHSLGIANHDTVMYGEVDFFVLAPRMGVFAIEVKGGRVSRTGGRWYFTDRYGKPSPPKARGPFEQAQEGVQSVIRDIKKRRDFEHMHIDSVLFGFGAIFPDIIFEEQGVDWEEWQVFDSRNGFDIVVFIKRLFAGTAAKWKELYGVSNFMKKLPSKQDVEYMAKLLRGDFDKRIALSIWKERSEERLIELTQEQYNCLDRLEDNPRVIVTGGAGTGKTLLAMEAAKRAAAEGERVALFCYNNQLGDWLETQMAAADSSPVYTGTFHKFMQDTVKASELHTELKQVDKGSEEFWKYQLPGLAALAIEEAMFDRIIVDEAQDLVSSDYIDVMDAALARGFVRGRWMLFGDFSMQAIYADMSGEEMLEHMEERSSFTRYKLTLNCRNTKPIGEAIRNATQYRPPREPWIRAEGRDVEFRTYSNQADQANKLRTLLKALETDKIAPHEITILSPRIRQDSVVSLLDGMSIQKHPGDGKHITFSTAQGFKGLENNVVVLVDIASYSDKQLMYVALSRARSILCVLETQAALEEYNKSTLGRMLDNG